MDTGNKREGRERRMDQQALLASLAQMNAGISHQGIAPMRSGAHHRQMLSSSGLASSPCFSMPGLTLQGFNGLQQHTQHLNQQAGSGLMTNTPFQTLLNASHAAAHPTAKVRPVLACTVLARTPFALPLALFPPRSGKHGAAPAAPVLRCAALARAHTGSNMCHLVRHHLPLHT